MHVRGLTPAAALCGFLLASSAVAQAPQQFKANIRMSGGSLDGPATGTMFFNGSRTRLELTVSGEQMIIIMDPASGGSIVLMPAEKMYMDMASGMAPVAAPRSRSMDPANPCAGGEATDCVAQGQETVNGYATRKWQYQVDGETQTSWIATQFRFPVRVVDGSGTTTDYTNITPGAQPAALFSPPADYQKMDMGMAAMMGAMSGRGGGIPGLPPGVTLPPGMDSLMTAAMSGRGAPIGPGAGSDPRYAQWEAGDGWIVDLVITASGQQNQPMAGGGTYAQTYSIRATASVPITYGTPGLAPPLTGQGPSWQLVAGLGSAKALAQPYTWSAEIEGHSDRRSPAACPTESATQRVLTSQGRSQGTLDNSSMVGGGALFQTSQDLRTFQVTASAGGSLTETQVIQVTTSGCGAPPATTTERPTREVSWSAGFNATGQPLPASPGTMTGTTQTPIRLQVGDFSGEVEGTIQWTLRPIQ